MKEKLNDALLIQRLAGEQRGVFSKADLETILADPHRASFVRRVQALLESGLLQRFCRGWYVVQPFDLLTLSQRMAPESYISFGTVPARSLLVGPRPENRVTAAKVGRTRTYRGLGREIDHVSIAKHLNFGHSTDQGIRFADPEKATLDVLYFHLRGRRFEFDVYSDIAYDRLDPKLLTSYLVRYRNKKFVTFAKGLLKLS